MNPKEEGDGLKNVPKEFRKFTKLFRREEEVRLLLRSRWDYIIELKLGTLGILNFTLLTKKKEKS